MDIAEIGEGKADNPLYYAKLRHSAARVSHLLAVYKLPSTPLRKTIRFVEGRHLRLTVRYIKPHVIRIVSLLKLVSALFCTLLPI